MHFVQLLQCTYVQLTFKLTIEDDVRLHFMSKFFSAFKWVSELFLDYKTIWLQGCKLSAWNMYFHIEKQAENGLQSRSSDNGKTAVWHYGLKLQWYLTRDIVWFGMVLFGFVWFSLYSLVWWGGGGHDWHGWLAWVTGMGDWHGWLDFYFYILISYWQTDGLTDGRTDIGTP